MKFNRATIVLLPFLASVLQVIVTSPKDANAQSNYPTSIVYLVRNEKGDLMDPAKLEAISSAKGEEMTPGKTFVKNADGTTSDDVKCLASRLEMGRRPVRLSELTLKFNGKTMHLIFH